MSSNSYLNCSICAQIYIKPSVLPCGHTFCKDCLGKWLQRRRVCPHCRKKVPGRFKPIGLSGWDDTLESLALLLPKGEQDERHAAKRQREEDEKSEPAKRSRIETRSGPTQLTLGQDDGDVNEISELDLNQTLDGDFNELADLILDEDESPSEAAADSDWEEDFLSEEEEEEGDLYYHPAEDDLEVEVSGSAAQANYNVVESPDMYNQSNIPLQYEYGNAGTFSLGCPHGYYLRSTTNDIDTQLLDLLDSLKNMNLDGGSSELGDEEEEDNY